MSEMYMSEWIKIKRMEERCINCEHSRLNHKLVEKNFTDCDICGCGCDWFLEAATFESLS